jgi:hypothetical protein
MSVAGDVDKVTKNAILQKVPNAFEPHLYEKSKLQEILDDTTKRYAQTELGIIASDVETLLSKVETSGKKKVAEQPAQQPAQPSTVEPQQSQNVSPETPKDQAQS